MILYFDSGASIHITSRKDLLCSLDAASAGKKVTCANNASYPIKGVGMMKSLLSVSSLAKNGLRVIFEDDKCMYEIKRMATLFLLQLVKQASHFRFFQKVIELRKKHPLLGRDSFLQEGDVTWHETDWENPGSHFLAFTFHDKEEKGEEIYAAFNAHTFFNNILLPASASGRSWYRVIDTNLPSPADVIEDGIQIQGGTYNMAPFSAIVLLAKP
ncbi:hypothetical protein L7F22_035333 [Adiantum nelumboides]|nr:hypothetical protein [Adiantum nelumboides]